VDVGDSSLKAD